MRITPRRLLLPLALATLLLAAGSAARAEDAAPSPGPDGARREQVLRIVAELREDAARIRGLSWKKEVPADLLSREQLRKNLEEMVRKELKPEEYERDLRTLRRLGLLREDEDLLELSLKFLEQGIAGYYDPETERLYLIDGMTGDAQRPTILHELVHALEDQYVDLEKRQKALEKDDDAGFALKCVVEGSAEYSRRAYEREHPDIAKLSAKEQRQSSNMGELQKLLKTTPALLILPTLLQYQIGPAFVTRAVGNDYAGGVARLWQDTPTTQEQVMHAGKFLGADRDLPRKIEWPKDLAATLGAQWSSDEDGPVGELDFALWMDRWVGGSDGRINGALLAEGRYYTTEAKKAAEGWDGARVQVLAKDKKPLGLVLVSAWDTPADALEAATVLEKALRIQYGGEFRTEGTGDGWREASGARALDFVGKYGPGRISVEGDVVRLVDGFADGTLETIWSKVEGIPVTRDPKDTWTPENAPDPLAGATWGVAALGIAWRAPGEGWTLESRPDAALASKGGLTLRLSTRKGGLQKNLLPLLVELKKRYPKAPIDASSLAGIEELEVGGKEAARLVLTDPKNVKDGRGRAAYVVPVRTGEGLLLIEAEAPRDAWEAAQADVLAALDGFLFED